MIFIWCGFLTTLMLICGVLFWLGMDRAIVVVLTLAAVAGIAIYELESRSRRRSLYYRQWGWLTARDCQFHRPGHVYRIRWSEATRTEVSSDQAIAHDGDESTLTIRRDDLLDGDWSRVVRWLETS